MNKTCRRDGLGYGIKSESGAGMVEYGLLIALIALIVATGAGILGTSLAGAFDEVTGLAGPATGTVGIRRTPPLPTTSVARNAISSRRSALSSRSPRRRILRRCLHNS